LVLDAIGASLVLWPLARQTKRDAIEHGVSRYGGESDEENLRLPAVRAILREVLWARWGFGLLIAGFVLQGGSHPSPPSCLQAGLEGEEYGIWRGLSPAERQRIRGPEALLTRYWRHYQ
jgi:hypothetical protein